MADISETYRFEPADGSVVMTAPGPGYGNWVGGKVSHDPESGTFALFYRERRPLELGRAGVCGVAVSDDGISFETVWTAGKGDFAANSIEEGQCVRSGGEWLLYVSYEIAGTSVWRIDVMSASSPGSFDSQSRRTVLSPADYGLSFIKDPFLMRKDDAWWLYAAASPREGESTRGTRRTARALDATILAVSDDGRYFPSLDYVFEAPLDDSWHGRRARINSVIEHGDGYIGFFDGGRTFYDNYEEKAGLATSPDGRDFTRIVTAEPWVSSPHGTVRYLCAVRAEDSVFYYYEYTRADGAHDLKVSRIDAPVA